MKKILMIGALFASTSLMAHDVIHANHEGAHTVDDKCLKIAHEGHIDHLHDGHLHFMHGDHVHEHVIAVSVVNPVDEGLVTRVDDGGHAHGAGDIDHPMIQHGDHFDFLHDGRLHHVHGDHVDDHGPVEIVD